MSWYSVNRNWGPDAYRFVNALKDAGVKVKLFGIYISNLQEWLRWKNLLFNDVIIVKEFNPTNPDAPAWYKDYEKGHLEKMGLTPDADRFRFMLEMFKAVIEKLFLWTKRYCICSRRHGRKKVDGGKIIMRKDDHQIHFDMQALLVSEKKSVYNLQKQDFDMSYVNVGNIPVEDITLDTSCEMKRP